MGNLLSRPVVRLVVEGLEEVLDQEKNDQQPLRGARSGNRIRNRGYALHEVNQLSESEFSSMFRMSREGFHELLNLVSPFLPDTDAEMANLSSGSPITKSTKLYVSLRFLAGGSYLDICFAWGIAKSTLFSTDPDRGVLWPTLSAIDQCFVIGLPVHNPVELERMAKEFEVYSHGELPGCVTAIDGWVAMTRKPKHDEVTDVMAYRNRHDCWGLVVLAGCDARCRFTMFSCKNSGSTNDCTAWEFSDLKKVLDDDRLPEPYYIIGDEAFVCTNKLLVPYSGRGLGVWRDSFNYHLSSMRQCIERSFAILVGRWGILWRPLRCSYNRWTLVLMVCAKLHNYCINGNIPLNRNRFYEDNEEDDAPDVILNADVQEEERETRATVGPGNRRAAFTHILEDKGVRRPKCALINSRA